MDTNGRTIGQCRRGFSLLEVIVALAVLGAVVAVGLGSAAAGSLHRTRVAEQVALRALAERTLAEVSALPEAELKELAGTRGGKFPDPWTDVSWVSWVREEGEGSGLYRVEVETRRNGAAFRAATYVNRFGERWRARAALED